MNKVKKQSTISKKDYLVIVGVIAIARMQNEKLKECEKLIAEVLKEKPDLGIDYYGHITDAVYGDYSADKLLGLMDIKVKK